VGTHRHQPQTPGQVGLGTAGLDPRGEGETTLPRLRAHRHPQPERGGRPRKLRREAHSLEEQVVRPDQAPVGRHDPAVVVATAQPHVVLRA
ncbi:hypothetical protein, partial [Mycobacterium tuberculosis]